MVYHIAKNDEMPRVEAYLLSSLYVDLKMSEIANKGEYVVSTALPLSIFMK